MADSGQAFSIELEIYESYELLILLSKKKRIMEPLQQLMN